MRLAVFRNTQRSTTTNHRNGGTIHGPERFKAIVHRERARVDRSGGQFCMVVFRMVGSAAPSVNELACTVANRARLTDDVGEYDSTSVAVLLPDTPPEGARKFAGDIRSLLGAGAATVGVKIYGYPHCDSGPRSTNHRNHNGIRPGRDARFSNKAPQEISTVEPRGRQQIQTCRAPVRSMDRVLIRPVPRWKRLLDITAAAGLLVASSPILLGAIIAVKLGSPGPAIFTQMRTGYRGRPFRIFKLRTMYIDAEQRQAALRQFSQQDGPAFKLRHDPRVTRIGSLLRKTSIDELPQLWNVLRGDMSLVGPRPLPCSEAAACRSWQQRRHEVMPGLTCIWQVKGRSRVSFDQWMRMDLDYVRRIGVVRDLVILLQTLPAVLLRRGAC